MIFTLLMSVLFLPYRRMKVQPNKVTFLSNRADRLTGNIKAVFFEMTKLDNVDITVLCKKADLKIICLTYSNFSSFMLQVR